MFVENHDYPYNLEVYDKSGRESFIIPYFDSHLKINPRDRSNLISDLKYNRRKPVHFSSALRNSKRKESRITLMIK